MLSFKVRNSSIKAMAYVILLALPVCLFNRCEDEKAQARSYPQVRTKPVSGITNNGAIFNGEIYSLGTEQIINHGFVWSQSIYPDLTDENLVLGPATKQGAFSSEVNIPLIKDLEYTVKAFVQTDEHTVYGLPVKFKSLGSAAPVVSGFSPDTAAWLDTIKISGINFSPEVSRNQVKLNNIQCKILSATDTLLIIEVSPRVEAAENIVSVEIEGNISEYTKDTLKLIPPELNDYFPKKAFWGDTLHLKGKHFRSFYFSIENTIKLGSYKCERVGRLTDTAISVIVPFDLIDLRSDLTMRINSITLPGKQQLELLPPYFTFSPKTGTWRSTVTLSGRFNAMVSQNTIYFNSGNLIYIKVQPEDVIFTSSDKIKIKVPNSVVDIKSTIIYEAGPFSIHSADTFKLAPPIISSFSPGSGPSGTLVTIKGKNFDTIDPVVMFGNISASCGAINDSVIIATVPRDLSDNVKISVIAKLQIAVSSQYFMVTNPKITQVSPLSGTFNDEITITGESFESPYVTFGGIPATIKSYTSTTIVVLVPLTIDSIPRVLTVASGFNSTSSTQKFTLTPPQILSESPAAPVAESNITITGNGFNPSPEMNIVLLDIYPLTIVSSSPSEIVATLPVSVPRGNFGIKVIVGGYSRSIAQSFSFDSPWLRIKAPEIPSTYPYGYYEGMSLYAKSLRNLGYIYSEISNETYEFDPSDRTFTKLNVSTPYDGSIHLQMAEVVCKDTIYLISGMYNGNKMWAFNDRNIGWRQIPLSASINNQAGVAFSLNDKIYFGLNYGNSSVWFFGCDPANNYTWVRKNDFPTVPSVPYASYFSVGNKGYVVFSDNSLWQFDPGTEQWTRKTDFPGPERKLTFSFVLSGKAYIGAGDSMHEYRDYDGLWMYDPDADTWALAARMPMGRNSAVAFAIGTKAYIGFGLKRTGGFPQSLFDFYEFDPNYPAK